MSLFTVFMWCFQNTDMQPFGFSFVENLMCVRHVPDTWLTGPEDQGKCAPRVDSNKFSLLVFGHLLS